MSIDVFSTVSPRPDAASLSLALLEEKHGTMLGWLESVEITNEAQQKNAEDLLIHSRAALKEIKAEEADQLKPSKTEHDNIKAAFKPLTDRITNGINAVTKGLGDWHREQRLAEKAERDEKLALLAEQMREAQENGEIVAPIEQRQVTPLAPTTSHTHLGSVSYIESFDVAITNPDLVPRDLCVPDMVRIRARVKSGVKVIPGVLIIPKYVQQARGAR